MNKPTAVGRLFASGGLWATPFLTQGLGMTREATCTLFALMGLPPIAVAAGFVRETHCRNIWKEIP